MPSFSNDLNWIDSQENRLLQKLTQWVEINSFSLHLEGLAKLLNVLSEDYKVLGGHAQHLKVPSFQTLAKNGTLEKHELGSILHIRKRPEAKRHIFLGGHMDTVYSPSHPFQKIEKQKTNQWKGPGISDMKGGLAILLIALEALERSPFAEQLGWEIMINADEEIGSPGSFSFFESAASRNHVGLIFEPAFKDGAFVSQRKGSINYTLVIHGRAAHVGRDFSQGKSAVFALSKLINQLEELNEWEDLTVNVADVSSQEPLNIVPSIASCRLNFRSFHSDILEQAKKHLFQFIEKCKEQGFHVNIQQDSLRLPKIIEDSTQNLFAAYKNCAEDLHIPFQMRSSGGVCDGNILASAGLPTLDTAGVVGGSLHTSDEFLEVPSLVERAKLAALFLFKFATNEFSFNKKGLND